MIIYNDESLKEFLGEATYDTSALLSGEKKIVDMTYDELREACTNRLIDNFGGVDSEEQKQPRFGDNIVIVKGKKYKRRLPFGTGKQGEDDAVYSIMVNKVDGDYFLLNHVIYKGEHIYV